MRAIQDYDTEAKPVAFKKKASQKKQTNKRKIVDAGPGAGDSESLGAPISQAKMNIGRGYDLADEDDDFQAALERSRRAATGAVKLSISEREAQKRKPVFGGQARFMWLTINDFSGKWPYSRGSRRGFHVRRHNNFGDDRICSRDRTG